ncbi:MAG: succinylglutamate desuccinylase/aspartoacylase family protein [Thermomicrobiales bacterium]
MVDALSIVQTTLSHFPAGAKTRCWLDVMPGMSQPVRAPLVVARGNEAGPTLMAVAGVHGDEYEGMEAIRRVFDRIDPHGLRGTFAGIPVANPFAYEARARVAPRFVDGLNLARMFPGNPDGTSSAVLADRLFGFITRNLGPSDLFIDFHSGSADVAYATIAGVRATRGPARAASEAAARHFGLSRLWEIPDARGPLNAETTRAGIPTIGTETTGRAGFDAGGCAAFATGLMRLLAFMGMINDHVPEPETGPFRPTTDALSPGTGYLRGAARLYDEVDKGQSLGTIVDVFGEVVVEVTAPVSGTVWAARAMCAVRNGEIMCSIARSASDDGSREDGR